MTKREKRIPIAPETKIGALLDHYPELEEILIETAPEFKKLRNPILRKTIARVTSLRQVAAVGKLSLAELINTLRSEAGIPEEFEEAAEEMPQSKEPPSWFDVSRIAISFDAGPMLESGGQPIQRVFSECNNLKPGEIYELITPFLPAPLIESAREKGYAVWTREEGSGIFKTYLMPLVP